MDYKIGNRLPEFCSLVVCRWALKVPRVLDVIPRLTVINGLELMIKIDWGWGMNGAQPLANTANTVEEIGGTAEDPTACWLPHGRTMMALRCPGQWTRGCGCGHTTCHNSCTALLAQGQGEGGGALSACALVGLDTTDAQLYYDCGTKSWGHRELGTGMGLVLLEFQTATCHWLGPRKEKTVESIQPKWKWGGEHIGLGNLCSVDR